MGGSGRRAVHRGSLRGRGDLLRAAELQVELRRAELVAVLAVRAAEGASVRELASEAGVSHMTVWRWLQGAGVAVGASSK